MRRYRVMVKEIGKVVAWRQTFVDANTICKRFIGDGYTAYVEEDD